MLGAFPSVTRISTCANIFHRVNGFPTAMGYSQAHTHKKMCCMCKGSNYCVHIGASLLHHVTGEVRAHYTSFQRHHVRSISELLDGFRDAPLSLLPLTTTPPCAPENTGRPLEGRSRVKMAASLRLSIKRTLSGGWTGSTLLLAKAQGFYPLHPQLPLQLPQFLSRNVVVVFPSLGFTRQMTDSSLCFPLPPSPRVQVHG